MNPSFLTQLSEWARVGRRSPLAPLLLVFLLISWTFEHNGGTNEGSRIAMFMSLTLDRSFEITRVQQEFNLTGDWSRTPDGRYFSNKAPGPVLVALPLYWSIAQVMRLGTHDRAEWAARLFKHKYLINKVMSLVFQALPFAFLGLVCLGMWSQMGVSLGVMFWSLAALLMGTTSGIFMSIYFGHSFAAWLCVLLFLAVQCRRPLAVGLCYGLLLLSDYGAAVLLPPLLLVLFLQHRGEPRAWLDFAWGGLLPGILWLLYHISCFGSPFALPNKYQNPVFVMSEAELPRYNLWGVLSLPSFTIFGELVWGLKRGLLCTQPWIVLMSLLILVRSRVLSLSSRPLAWLAFFGLLGLLLMNASFNGWHGGSTTGPRYLAMGLPVFALFLPEWLQRKGWLSWLLWATVIYSVVLNTGIFASHVLLFDGYTNLVHIIVTEFYSDPWRTPALRMYAVILLSALIYWRARR